MIGENTWVEGKSPNQELCVGCSSLGKNLREKFFSKKKSFVFFLPACMYVHPQHSEALWKKSPIR